MKKSTRQVLAFFLALTLALSCMCMEAFAANADNVKQYGAGDGGYLAIGDSIGRGLGAAGYHDTDSKTGDRIYDNYDYRNVRGAFPYIVAEAVGCNAPTKITDQTGNYWPLCYPGMTLSVTMDLMGIDDNFTDSKFNYENYDDMVEHFGCESSFPDASGANTKCGGVGTAGRTADLVKKSSLITIELGMCDVFYRALRVATSNGSFAGGFNVDTSNVKELAEVAATFAKEIYNGYNYWKSYYPVFLQKIQELNPDATIVMVGSFNMASDVSGFDETLVPIGDILTAVTAAMNVKYRQWAKQYNVLYADISNTESYAAEQGWSFLGEEYMPNNGIASHPGPNGYEYIARQILSVLPEATEESTDRSSTDIVVDLGRFTKVDYVMVNGVLVDNYTMDGYQITIPYSNKLATNMTIAVVDEDGKVAIQTYDLKYNDGYTAYRIYGNNDAVSTAVKPVKNIFSIGSKIFTGLSGLVKK